MTDEERFKLLFGPYKTPVFRYGDSAFCERRGNVTLCGLTDAPIPWPIGKGRTKRTWPRAIVLFGDLAEAVRRESALAVAYWWGVKPQTVTVWRNALGVGPMTEGTLRLHHDYFQEPWGVAAREK